MKKFSVSSTLKGYLHKKTVFFHKEIWSVISAYYAKYFQIIFSSAFMIFMAV